MEILGVTIPEYHFASMEDNKIRNILAQQPKWTEEHTSKWRAQQKPVREYKKDIVKRLFQSSITDSFEIIKYGALSHDPERFPLYYLKSKNWNISKPSIYIEGGVHGYEPSGIFASIEFAEKNLLLSKDFNFVIVPCMSPWGYEHDHRWNYDAQDPNRGHIPNSDIEECVFLMKAIKDLNVQFDAAIDLHETPDRDKSLRIMRASRFGSQLSKNYLDIPQGFYLVLDTDCKKDTRFADNIINSVATKVDISKNDLILDVPNDNGAVYIDISGLGATWMRENNFAKFAATTEVYSTPIGEEKSIEAQIAAINGICKFVKPSLSLP